MAPSLLLDLSVNLSIVCRDLLVLDLLVSLFEPNSSKSYVLSNSKGSFCTGVATILGEGASY